MVDTLAGKSRLRACQDEVGGKGLSTTIPEPFNFKTVKRAGERGEFERMKRLRETAAEEEKMRENKRKLRAEQEDVLKVRKVLVHKAQPVKNYKPLAIKRSEKKLTLPASPHLGVIRGSGK